MAKYLFKRVLQMLLTLFLFQLITFMLIEAQPGDITDIFLANPNIPPSVRVRIREQLGLDRPPIEQFLTYAANFYRGNLGVSFQQYPKPVVEILQERLPRTIVLFVTATLISFWGGYVMGKLLAWRRGGIFEYATTIAGVTLYTIFLPWFALMMIWFFAVQLDWLPAGKFLDPIKWLDAPVRANEMFQLMIITTVIALSVSFAVFVLSNRLPRRQRPLARLAGVVVPLVGLAAYWIAHPNGFFAGDIAIHLIMPIGTVTLISFAGYMLLMRTSMLETLREDYILTARAKGLSEKVIRDKHAARNALLPVVTSLVFGIAFAVQGGIITETIFSWPGIGLTVLNAALVADIPVAMGALTVIGILTLFGHLLADIAYAYLDPRIRYH